MRFKRSEDRERFNDLIDHVLRLYSTLAGIEHYIKLRWNKTITVISAGHDWAKIAKDGIEDRQWAQVRKVYYDELEPADGDSLAVRDCIILRLAGAKPNGNGELSV